jgi:hypothetical protein
VTGFPSFPGCSDPGHVLHDCPICIRFCLCDEHGIDRAVERIRAASFDAPRALSATEWERRIKAILEEYRRGHP